MKSWDIHFGLERRKKDFSIILTRGYEGDAAALKAVYAPIGLDLGGDSAAEIAFCILSEIMLVKNRGQLKHMRD